MDINKKECNLLSKIIDEYNENNLAYQWFPILDINNKLIIVKKENLLNQKMTNEEKQIIDYLGEKYKIIPGKVCRPAKKYHITIGPKEENILYLIKDLSNNFHFVKKIVLNIEKNKQTLKNEMNELKIIDKNDNNIVINFNIIDDLEVCNVYNEWCEIEDINNNKIIVRKKDLVDLKEIYDKNIDGGKEIQKINDWKYDTYDIKINSEFLKNFPNKYIYLSQGNERKIYSEINGINNNKVLIKTSLIEYYLTENIDNLSLYEEIYDKNNIKRIINPKSIITNILFNYDIIPYLNGPFIELLTKSGKKHIIKISTINKILKIGEEKKETNDDTKVSIKISNGVKIYTTLNKIKNINLKDNNNILLCFNDVNGKNGYFKKNDIINKVNNKIINPINGDYLCLEDINRIKRYIEVSQIKIINKNLKKNSLNN